MSDIIISQSEADELFAMEKVRIDERTHSFPQISGKLIIPLRSRDGREKFLLDVHIGHIELKKAHLQNRARNVIILARLDTMGKHTNPDGNSLTGSHLHLYREGYGDRWAYPVPAQFTNLANLLLTVDEFMKYCNIVEAPIIQGSCV
ncbi:MAG: hypothetical protein LHW56_01380 [Candidatus Cloacimonetes bacterium]|nr:hypothetical protein [Candidatus Cloacimonadota bacterium]MDY0171538.1 hypothetical protein [Candidatus Cloacimonadaceae bacterium]